MTGNSVPGGADWPQVYARTSALHRPPPPPPLGKTPHEPALRTFPDITQVQFAPTSAGELTILTTAPQATWTDAEATARVHEDVRKTDQGIDLTAITVKTVHQPTLSIAGKVPKTLPVDAWNGDR